VVLRLLVLKYLYDWSFDECEREVRGHLVYRAFCRIDGERVPDAKTLIRLAHLLDEALPLVRFQIPRTHDLGILPARWLSHGVSLPLSSVTPVLRQPRSFR
jgi:hypothetical protein